jgi:hypothetical protein
LESAYPPLAIANKTSRNKAAEANIVRLGCL